MCVCVSMQQMRRTSSGWRSDTTWGQQEGKWWGAANQRACPTDFIFCKHPIELCDWLLRPTCWLRRTSRICLAATSTSKSDTLLTHTPVSMETLSVTRENDSVLVSQLRYLSMVTCVCDRDCPDVRMDELKPFTVPAWMVEKMQRAMEAQRDVDLWHVWHPLFSSTVWPSDWSDWWLIAPAVFYKKK